MKFYCREAQERPEDYDKWVEIESTAPACAGEDFALRPKHVVFSGDYVDIEVTTFNPNNRKGKAIEAHMIETFRYTRTVEIYARKLGRKT